MHLPAAGVFTARVACLWCALHLGAAKESQELNYRPIVGVLAQEKHSLDYDANGSTYISASYVKFLEGGGARVVPIRLNLTKEEYTKLFNSINGLLLPGGDVDLEKSQCTEVARMFYDMAVKANDAGDYFPIWGACQGFQQLSFITANENLLILTDTKGVALPVTITPVAHSSRLFRSFPKDLLQSLFEENITSNFHSWSLSTRNFSQNAKLNSFYKVLSTNTDGKTEFISTMEAYRYPFYAVQWHPEKSAYEWVDKPGMVHSTAAVSVNFYAARFFVSEAMKNHHRFSSPEEEQAALIYNFAPVLKHRNFIYMQVYYFDL